MSADELAAEALTLAHQVLADVEHLHPQDGTRILVTAAASTTIAILSARAEMQRLPQVFRESTVHFHGAESPASAAEEIDAWVRREPRKPDRPGHTNRF